MAETLHQLQRYFKELGGVTIAFSGGVDSSLLLSIAHKALGENVLAVSCRVPGHTQREIEEAVALAKQIGVTHRVVEVDPLQDDNFRANDEGRCYYCKKVLLRLILELAADAGLPTVIEGSNADDRGDYRPGLAAVRELGVRSPLVELNIGKDKIRQLAHDLNLPVWDKPAAACLISRLPYGTKITNERLRRIERAEEILRAAGIWPARARDHGDLVRIETNPQRFPDLLDEKRRRALVADLQAAGYTYVAIDLQGYRTGAMNEALGKASRSDYDPQT